MKPTVGLHIDPFYSYKPSEDDKSLAEWAASRGLFLAILGYPDENDELVPYRELGIEEWVDGTLFVYQLSLPERGPIWPQALDHFERLLHVGLERQKEEKLRFKWWEHVSR